MSFTGSIVSLAGIINASVDLCMVERSAKIEMTASLSLGFRKKKENSTEITF